MAKQWERVTRIGMFAAMTYLGTPCLFAGLHPPKDTKLDEFKKALTDYGSHSNTALGQRPFHLAELGVCFPLCNGLESQRGHKQQIPVSRSIEYVRMSVCECMTIRRLNVRETLVSFGLKLEARRRCCCCCPIP